MLLPALNRAREQARQTKCASNQRQLFTAVAMYTLDNGEFLPFAAGRRSGDYLGAWSIPMNSSTIPWNKWHGATTNLIAQYLYGPVNSLTDRSHVLRCPSNARFVPLGGDFNQYHSTYFYLAQAGFLEPNSELVVPYFYKSFNQGVIDRIVAKYHYPFLYFVDRVDFRRRWENLAWNTYSDSNHGLAPRILGGNAAYSDGHVAWHAYRYQFTGNMSVCSGWNVAHNDAWDAFAIPNDCTAWVKNGNRTRFFYGPNVLSGVPWYDPL